MDFLGITARRHTLAAAAVVFVALGGCEASGPPTADRLRSMTDKDVAAYAEAARQP